MNQLRHQDVCCCFAAGEWGNVSWAREGGSQPLAGHELETAKAAAGSYSMVVEDSLSAEDATATVGQRLREAWPKVTSLSRLQMLGLVEAFAATVLKHP
jgi:hypothetical protein